MIYLLRCEQDTDLLKAGFIKIGTSVKLTIRLKQIAADLGHMPTVLAVIDGSYAEEKVLHDRFSNHHVDGEWFNPEGTDLLKLIAIEGRSWDGSDEADVPSQARIELPANEMDRVRKAAKSIGLSLSAFIRQAVMEKAVDVERRMRL